MDPAKKVSQLPLVRESYTLEEAAEWLDDASDPYRPASANATKILTIEVRLAAAGDSTIRCG